MSLNAETISNGSISKHRGGWRGVLRYKTFEGKWKQLQTTLKDESGEKIPSKKKGNTGRAAAERALKIWRDSIVTQEGNSKGLTNSKLSVYEYAIEYLDNEERGQNIQPSTVKDYRKSAKYLKYDYKNINLDQVLIKELTPSDVEEWKLAMLNEPGLTGKPLSNSTVAKHMRFLTLVCNDACKKMIIRSNPASFISKPTRKSKVYNSADEKTAARISLTLNSMANNELKIAASLGLQAGMRVGEVSALQWKHIDLKNKYIYVRQAIGEGEVTADNKNMMLMTNKNRTSTYVKMPKNEKSIRDIPLTDNLCELLQDYKQDVLKKFDNMGIRPTENQLNELFILGDLTGDWIEPRRISNSFHNLAKACSFIGLAGRPMTFHDLRHTNATLQIRSGSDVVSVSNNLGHAKTSTTTDMYANVTPKGQKDAINSMQELLNDSKEEQSKLGEVILFRTGTDN